MARRKKGVKIKHRKTIYKKRKSKGQKIFTFCLAVFAVVGLVFLGYSIGEPIKEFLNDRQNLITDSSSTVWSPPETTSETTTAVTTDKEDEISKPNSEELIAYSLPINSTLSEQALTEAVVSAKNSGFSAAVVTLKADGGQIYYLTENETAKSAGAVVGTLTAPAIVKIITDNGMTPVAEINVLKDHIAPKGNSALSYKFENQDTVWYDNDPAQGGKPWLSPFSDATKTYISQISDEIARAGFTKIIASGIVFPPFLQSDLNYIGATVKDANRHIELTAMAQIIKTQANLTQAETDLKIPALDILSGKSEVFVPEELLGIKIVAEINPSQIPDKIILKDTTELNLLNMGVYDKVKAILQKTSDYAGENVLVPSILKTGLSEADYNEVLRALTDLGYKSYILN